MSQKAVRKAKSYLITAVGNPGQTAAITATTTNGLTFTIAVTVAIPVQSVLVSPPSKDLTTGQSYRFISTVYPFNADNQVVRWESSNPQVASVEHGGLVTALRAGTTEIRVISECGGRVASAVVRVRSSQPATSPGQGGTGGNGSGGSGGSGGNSLFIGNRPFRDTMTLTRGERTLTANREVTWQSQRPLIASIDRNGVVRTYTEGNTMITARCVNTGETSRFFLEVVPFLLYQSPRRPGLNADRTIADDMEFNNKTRDDLRNMHSRLGTQARRYGDERGGPDRVFADALSLATTFTSRGYGLRPVAQEMFQRFFDGSGEDFRNDVITNSVFTHASTNRFMGTVEDELAIFLRNNRGDFGGVQHSRSNVRPALNQTRPRFNTLSDSRIGLRITINDTWGNYIELLEFNRTGNHIEYRIRVTIYDHFGLDEDDTRFVSGVLASTIANGSGFAAWYVLQHYRGTDNRHNPFISYFSREFIFRTTI